MSRFPLLVAVFVLALLQVGRAQEPQAPAAPPADQSRQQAEQPQQPTFRGEINFVRVDVIVTDGKDQPATDLTQADFQVFEDGKAQPIEQFKLIRVDGNPPPGAPVTRQGRVEDEAELSRDDVRLFVIFFDDYHVRLANAVRVREPLIRFVQQHLRPNDVVALMYPLTPLNDVTFTRDHESVVRAIDGFEGRKFDYRPRNQFEEQYAFEPTEVVERIRNQVVTTALRGLATRLGGLREGRKAIIYVSEGLTAMLPPQMRSMDAQMPATLSNPAARDPRTGENSSIEETAAFFAQTDVMQELREVFGTANRNNATFYAVDPRGLAVSEFQMDENVGPNQDRRALQFSMDTLRILAEETDGRAIINRNDLAPGLAQIVRDSSVYYLLGYTSQAPTDGKFHEIKVQVKRRGVEVRARRGYWAPTAADVERVAKPAPEKPKEIQQALASISSAVKAAKYVRTWIGTSRGEAGKTRVTLVWEPLPQPPGLRRTDPQPGRVSVIAADAAGDLVFRGRAPDAAIASAAAARTNGSGTGAVRALAAAAATGPQRLTFDAPPGDLELQMSVEAAGDGGVLDQETRSLTVPDFDSPDTVLSTPRVYRVRTARELQAVAADAAAVPVAGREFSRAERLLIRFDVYGTGGVKAALLNREGQKMADLPVTTAAAGGTHQIDFGLSSVATGEYLVSITAQGSTGEATELVPLRIGT